MRGVIPQLIYPPLFALLERKTEIRQAFIQRLYVRRRSLDSNTAMHSPQLIKAYQIWYAFSIRTPAYAVPEIYLNLNFLFHFVTEK